MPVQFFLKYDEAPDLDAKFHANIPPASGHHKGFVFEIDFRQLSGSPVYRVVDSVHAVNGAPGASGALPPIPQTLKAPCPNRPPCLSDASGNLIKDAAGNFMYDTGNPDAANCY